MFYVELELRPFLPESSSLRPRSAVGFLPQTGLMENGFLFERMQIQSLHWSQIQADHFQDKSIFIELFFISQLRLPLCLSWRPPHTGNITPSHKPWRWSLAALAQVWNLRHGGSRYGLLLISLAEVWSASTLGNSFVVYRWWEILMELKQIIVSAKVLFKPQMLGLRLQKLRGIFHFISISIW